MPVRTRRRPSSGDRVLAVDLGGTKVAVAVVTSRGAVRNRITEPVDTSSPRAAVDQIVRLARDAGGDPAAIGIAVPGLARPDGTVWAPNLPGWDRMPLGRLLRQKLRLPVTVESDRNAAVLGEAWRGAARGRTDVVSLIIGTGIGAGILSGGRIVRGAHELSGCAGWLVVTDETNEQTSKSGSLEALAAGPAVARLAGALSAEELAEKARRGDARARAAFARAGRLLGLAVANLINTLDPQAVVLGGGLSAASDLFLDDLRRAALERGQPLSTPEVEITLSTLGGDANLLGAARAAFADLEERSS
ncbi:MAG TPA: ROK family protein [Thermoanaerobaculia bacterium]|nr:ROK family protein [Thermoanaerobaculia bacterium]